MTSELHSMLDSFDVCGMLRAVGKRRESPGVLLVPPISPKIMPGTVLGTGDRTVNKANKNSCPPGTVILGERAT